MQPIRVFIDGEAGTTGLGIRDRLAARSEFRLVAVDPARRKDPAARAEAMAAADVAVLCLPDDAAREAAALAASLPGGGPRLLDASTAHRVADGWVYGFAELSLDQPAAIAAARRVANPGCYPTGAIALIRPLVDAGLLPSDFPISIAAVSGYSGGGRAMIESYEKGGAPQFELYALGLEHKHVPEIMRYGGLVRRPIFVPSVGAFRQGMLVSIPLHLDSLPGRPSASDIEAALAARYRGSAFVSVVPASGIARLEPEALNGTNRLELFVFRNDAHRHVVLVARLDNLGKGASAAAVQNLETMFGLLASPAAAA